jgi:hypothetical protein
VPPAHFLFPDVSVFLRTLNPKPLMPETKLNNPDIPEQRKSVRKSLVNTEKSPVAQCPRAPAVRAAAAVLSRPVLAKRKWAADGRPFFTSPVG